MVGFDFKDDTRQAFVVMRNEITKFLRGKKIILFTLLIVSVLALLTAVLFIFGDDDMTGKDVCEVYASFASLIVLVAVTLFSSTSIASEFEERTALILFTKPIRKWSIYFGKFMASILIETAYLVAFYAITIGVSLAKTGEFPGAMGTSLVLAFCYMLGATGIALLISSVMKKSSTSSIMTFVTLLLLLSVVSMSLTIADYDPYWMFDQAANSITYCITGLGVDITTYERIPYTHEARDASVMIIWGVAALIAGFFLFRKRDF